DAGASVTFSVLASGDQPLGYQWQRNNQDITGATASTYTIANVQPFNAAAYTVIVSNSLGTVTSASATLVVHEPFAVTTVGGGFVCKNPARLSYDLNSPVTLMAVPYSGWAFGNWSGDAA